MLAVEVYIGIITATIPPITQVAVVDCWLYNFLLVLLTKMFMVMRELEIGLRPATINPITQAEAVYYWVALLLHVLLKKVFMVMRGVTSLVMTEDKDVCLKRPDTILLKIKKEVFVVMGEVDIGTSTATLPNINQYTVVYCWIYLLLITLLVKVLMVTKDVISVVMMEVVDLGLNRIDNIPFKITEKVLMVMGEMDIGFRPAPIPHITQV